MSQTERAYCYLKKIKVIPVHCGRISLPAYKDEVACHVKGLHKPIISEALFYDVQDYLDGKKRTYRNKMGSLDIFQLRGYLICPKFGKLLTASASTGRSKKYHYYHCHYKCGSRFNADDANNLFVKELKKLMPVAGMEEVYKLVLLDEFNHKMKTQFEDIKDVKK